MITLTISLLIFTRLYGSPAHKLDFLFHSLQSFIYDLVTNEEVALCHIKKRANERVGSINRKLYIEKRDYSF